MKLLSFDEIQYGLDKEFLPLEPVLEGFRLKSPGLGVEELTKCEFLLRVVFPADFRMLISVYDFGNLTIGPIAFCASGDYSNELFEYNEKVSWWGDGPRPVNLIMVANSDPYAIVLNVESGEVLAIDPDLGLEKASMIAESFESFVRGVGSVFLLRNAVDDKEILAKSIHDFVGSHDIDFWSVLAK